MNVPCNYSTDKTAGGFVPPVFLVRGQATGTCFALNGDEPALVVEAYDIWRAHQSVAYKSPRASLEGSGVV